LVAFGARSGERPSRSSRSLGRVGRKAGVGGGFPAGRPGDDIDDIDDIDDVDDPRTEGRRRRVRLESGTPENARKAEGGGCDLRRRVVDVVDVVG
jgi:hypothetical protein